jgi:hypothetical protein
MSSPPPASSSSVACIESHLSPLTSVSFPPLIYTFLPSNMFRSSPSSWCSGNHLTIYVLIFFLYVHVTEMFHFQCSVRFLPNKFLPLLFCVLIRLISLNPVNAKVITKWFPSILDSSGHSSCCVGLQTALTFFLVGWDLTPIRSLCRSPRFV